MSLQFTTVVIVKAKYYFETIVLCVYISLGVGEDVQGGSEYINVHVPPFTHKKNPVGLYPSIQHQLKHTQGD